MNAIKFADVHGNEQVLDLSAHGTFAYNADCMDVLKALPDYSFDLAVIDPPYGIERFKNKATSRIKRYGNDMRLANDEKPTAEYFRELMRVSANQIIWGWNHLSDMLPPCKEFLVWYKHQPVDTYSDAEIAWTSFTKTARVFDHPFFGAVGHDPDGRIHPMQKPVALYQWIYDAYADPGYKILDTHLGSGSSRIAAYDRGLDFVGIEIGPGYFGKEEARFLNHANQLSLFPPATGGGTSNGGSTEFIFRIIA